MQIYLDDVTVENGCLWMVPGSHAHGILPGIQNKGALDRLYTDMERYRGEAPVAIEVPAGSVIFFHAHVIHGSKGNKTNSARRAMVITYQPAGNKCWKVDTERPIRM
jgi:ectoine hydroxylase-related dioxygenase (phytanoyl-CoA dioxygenase family)